jgi:hypothetical protein
LYSVIERNDVDRKGLTFSFRKIGPKEVIEKNKKNFVILIIYLLVDTVFQSVLHHFFHKSLLVLSYDEATEPTVPSS